MYQISTDGLSGESSGKLANRIKVWNDMLSRLETQGVHFDSRVGVAE